MLQVLGVKSITFKDIIDKHILPAFTSVQACQLPANTLVSYLAFISLSGLLSTSKFDAQSPDTAAGKRLLKELQQSAVICTNRGAMKAGSVPIYFPMSLNNKVWCMRSTTIAETEHQFSHRCTECCLCLYDVHGIVRSQTSLHVCSRHSQGCVLYDHRT